MATDGPGLVFCSKPPCYLLRADVGFVKNRGLKCYLSFGVFGAKRQSTHLIVGFVMPD